VWEVDGMDPLDDDRDHRDLNLYLDGVTQSSTGDEKLYHEHLIHPAMLAHPSGAQRVAILGGGEGASLREVLKHDTVTEVFMIEIDEAVVNASVDQLHQLNNCAFGSQSR
jgi:spermidine synthase